MSETKSGGKWTLVGTILKKKDGSGNYFKVKSNMTLTEGQVLTVQNPRKRPGITEEQLAKIPDFVVADLFLPPARD